MHGRLARKGEGSPAAATPLLAPLLRWQGAGRSSAGGQIAARPDRIDCWAGGPLRPPPPAGLPS